MKKNIKIGFSVVAALLIALFMGACGNKQASKENASTGQNKADTQQEDENIVELTQEQDQTVGVALGSPEKGR